MAEYYASINGQQQGPFPGQELTSRGARADSLVWTEGMPEWRRADAVPELAGFFHAAPPPPPPAYPAPRQTSYSGPTMAPPVPYYGPTVPTYNPANSNRVAAGVCGILLGALGVHKFILGMKTPGLIMLLVSVLTCGFGAWVMGVIGLIEGIIYLTKSDAEFHQTYVVEKRAWF